MSQNITKLELGYLENSHRFLNEAVAKAKLASSDAQQWMFAVSALVQSVELALKARLIEIHPILIYENIDRPKRTVSISQATQRLTSKFIGKFEFSERDKKRLKRAIDIRNELTHSDFSINVAQVEANFHEVFAFLTEFNRRAFSINMDELIEASYLVEFLDNRKHHQEMLTRAITRIEDEGITDNEISSCTYCTEYTFIKYNALNKCYLCHREEETVECQNCGEYFLDDELEDFFEAFETDYCEGQIEVHNDYGYSYCKACQTCTTEIREDINSKAEQYHYDQMMEDYYQDQKAAAYFNK